MRKQHQWTIEIYGPYSQIEKYNCYGSDAREAIEKAISIYTSEYKIGRAGLKGNCKKVKQS